jgi:glucose-6-phosphate 1-epimerase
VFTLQHTVKDGLDLIQLGSDSCHATFSKQGAQLLTFDQAGLAPMLWRNPQATYQPGVAVRQGIPLCWPWFGDLRRNPAEVRQQFQCLPDAPAHGLVRQVVWTPDAGNLEKDWATITFRTEQPAVGLSLAVTYRLTHQDLEIRLTTENRTRETVALSLALHTYFAVSDIANVSISGLQGTPYIETLDNWSERIQSGPLHIEGETDRIYYQTPPRIELQDNGLQRAIQIESKDSRSAIVWNPWTEKAARLSQFAAQDYRTMLCIETARAWTDFLLLEPTASHESLVRLSQRSL